MGLPPFLKLGCVLLLLACGLSATRCLYADEAPVTASDLKEEAFGSAADQGRLAWAILEAIEQQHIAPPPRQVLIRVVTRALFRVPKDTVNDFPYRELLERVDAEFLQCQNADEMAHVVERIERLHFDFDRVLIHLTSGFGEILGDFRLIRAKDHDVEEQLHGNRYVGVGVNLSVNDSSHLPVFVRIRPGGPADRGGLTPNTYIHEIDGRPTEKVPQEKIFDWIRGPIGSEVTLKVSSDKSKEQRLVTLTRGLVRVESLADRARDSLSRVGLRYDRREPIGWITVAKINGSTLHEFRVAEHLAKEDGIRVLVLDFRLTYHELNDLHQALLVADGFLDGGAIWEKTDRLTDSRVENADRECLFREMPLVVVIDQSTSPTHCAIAAALQDAGRAKLVGESPRFKGVISSTVRLSGVPFSLSIATTRLNRASRDRQWPLLPDYNVAENTAASVNNTAIPKGFRIGDRVILDSDLNSKSSDIKKTPNSIETTRSAYPQESAQDSQRRSNAPNAFTRDSSPNRPEPPKRKLPIEDVAILVALELQRGLPTGYVPPVKDVQASKEKH